MATPSTPAWYATPAWRRIFIIAGSLLLLLVVAIAAYNIYRPIRAQQLAKEALQLATRGQLVAARNRVMAARDLAPRQLEVARAVAKVWTQIAPTQVVALWEYALELSGGALEDRQALVLALIDAGESERAKTEMEAVLQAAPTDPQTTFVHASYLLSIGRGADAMAKAESLLDTQAGSPGYWRLYASIAKRLGGVALEAYSARLQTISANPGPLGLWGLTELAKLSTPANLEARLQPLLAHPRADRDTILFAYQLRRELLAMPYTQIRSQVEPYYNMADMADRLELARYYRSIGDGDGVLILITPKVAQESRENLMLYLDGLATAGRWQALLEVLDFPKLPLEDYWREIFRARALASLGRSEESVLAWRKSLLAAGSNIERLADISTYLFTLGAVAEVDEVMPKVIENSSILERPIQYVRWLQFHMARRDTARLQDILAQMVKAYPDNTAYRNDYIYYSLLLDKPGQWVEQAYQLAKAAPSVVAHRMTLALALLRADQPAKALEVVNSTRISTWTSMPAGWQLIRAAVLRANGQAAPTVANTDGVLPQERALAP